MATVDDILEEALRLLIGSQVETENVLSGAIDADDTTLTFSYDINGISAGSVLSSGAELMRVWTVNSDSKTAVVRRGYRGSVAAAHASGALVTVNPKYSKTTLLKALEEDVRDLSSPTNGLYQVSALNDTYEPATVGYDLPVIEDFIDVYKVSNLASGPGNHWSVLKGWTLDRNQDTTSGLRLELPNGWVGSTLRIQYKHGFAWPSNTVLTDDITTKTGVPLSMHDILVSGILMRVGPHKEIQRNQPEAQGSSRRAEEVAPGSITRSYSVIAAQRQARIRAEALRLSKLYPDIS
jgi:hypothetical protein